MHRRQWRVTLRFVDCCCIGYLLSIGALLAVVGREADGWLIRVFSHGALSAAIVAVLALSSIHPGSRWIAWLRILYPVAVIAFAWNELSGIVPVLFGGYWATDWLLRADQFLFGVHPTLWMQRLYGGPLDEVMNVFYSGYYFFMPVICLSFLSRGRRGELFAIVSLITFTYLVSDLFYYLIPALGPRMVPEIADSMTRDYGGYLFGPLTRQAQASGGVRGACFPSSHVAGSIAWCLAVRRYDRRLAIGLMVVAAGVPVASVYLGYHHAVDAIAGIAVGFGCHKAALALARCSLPDVRILRSIPGSSPAHRLGIAIGGAPRGRANRCGIRPPQEVSSRVSFYQPEER